MFKKGFKYIFIVLFLMLSFLTINQVSADETYGSLDARIYKNQKMLDLSNKATSLDRERYTDKYLKDYAATNYKGLTVEQQKKVQTLADKTILANNKQNMTYKERVLKFHDWIVENFYYYQYPNKISSLSANGKNYDNPYYLLTYEYETNGKIRARSDGFATMLVALARSQGIPAKTVGGYYYKDARTNYINWGSNVNSSTINHIFVQVYVNGSWIVVDPMADSYKEYNETTNEYTNNVPTTNENYNNKYFNPHINDLSKTHVMLRYYSGSNNIRYLTNSYEKTKITNFLNKVYNKKTNGKRINSSYNKYYPSTWFTNGTSSTGDGMGKISKLYWPSGKGLYGSLDLSGFSSLQKLSVYNNRITSLNLSNCPSINTVLVAYNKMSKIVITGSKNLTLLSAQSNPTTYVRYDYSSANKTAIIKSTTGGTISVRYEKTANGQNKHQMKAVAKTGYEFKGWYSGSKKIKSSSSITVYNNQSFTYTAKFAKKPKKTYILISIKSQKLWYYKNGKLKLTTKVVTGQKGKHDTPKGTYKIRGKARSVYLVGPDYRSYVNYWMLIDRRTQIGLHDATWRGSFGGTIYKRYGSHGCINLPYSKAKYIYKYAPVGTTVIIK